MAKKSFYVLGGKASAFFDPLQSKEENKFLNAHECKELEVTERVTKALKGDGLKKLTEEEAAEWKKNHEVSESSSPSTVSLDEAQKLLDEASKKEESAKIVLKENDNLKDSLNKERQASADLLAENEKLKIALKEASNKSAK
jgi:hypothetical protein